MNIMQPPRTTERLATNIAGSMLTSFPSIRSYDIDAKSVTGKESICHQCSHIFTSSKKCPACRVDISAPGSFSASSYTCSSSSAGVSSHKLETRVIKAFRRKQSMRESLHHQQPQDTAASPPRHRLRDGDNEAPQSSSNQKSHMITSTPRRNQSMKESFHHQQPQDTAASPRHRLRHGDNGASQSSSNQKSHMLASASRRKQSMGESLHLQPQDTAASPRHRLRHEEDGASRSSSYQQSHMIISAPRRSSLRREDDVTVPKPMRPNRRKLFPFVSSTNLPSSNDEVGETQFSCSRSTCASVSNPSSSSDEVLESRFSRSRTTGEVPLCRGSVLGRRGIMSRSCHASILGANSARTVDACEEGEAEPTLLQAEFESIEKGGSAYAPTGPPNEGEAAQARDTFLGWSEEERSQAWECQTCTFVNENALHLACDMCGTLCAKGSSSNRKSFSFFDEDLHEDQQAAIRSKSHQVEEKCFVTLQQERIGELIQLQKKLLAACGNKHDQG
jgi:hypothetical protein